MPERKWTHEVIPYQTDCGLVAIAARVLGPIAVHFGIGSQAGRISITHVGTGRRIASTDLASIARQAGEALAATNWDCVTGNSVPEPLGNEVRQILKRYGLLPTPDRCPMAGHCLRPHPCPGAMLVAENRTRQIDSRLRRSGLANRVDPERRCIAYIWPAKPCHPVVIRPAPRRNHFSVCVQLMSISLP